MTSLVDAVSQLEQRKEQLVRELAEVDARLQAVREALKALPGAVLAAPAETAAKVPATLHAPETAPAVAASARKKPLKPVQWFQPGEASRLVKKLARQPVSPAQLVELMARAKGYDKLPPEKMRRFKGAAFMAVTTAVRNKEAVRNKDGLIKAA